MDWNAGENRTRGDNIALVAGVGILGTLFVLELLIGWGFTRRPVWISIGIVTGLIMLATATAVDSAG